MVCWVVPVVTGWGCLIAGNRGLGAINGVMGFR